MKTPIFSNRTYDVLKFVAQIVLPALATFYITVAPLWGLPKQEEVAGTLIALDFLLGALLRLSTKAYDNSDAKYDGYIEIEPNAAEDTTDLNLSLKPDSLEAKDDVVLEVKRPDEGV